MRNYKIRNMFFFIVLVIFSCNEDIEEPIPETEPEVAVVGVEISPENVKVRVGATTQLMALILPDTASNSSVSWSSSNSDIVSVDDSGMITANAQGNAAISVISEDGDFEAICQVDVTNSLLYEVSDEDFANPERGFYKYSSTKSDNYTNLSVATMKGYRDGVSIAYDAHSSLVFRYYIMSDYVNSSIPQEFLDNVQIDFDAAREAGVKLIPRFTYINSVSSGDCPSGWVCPPYGDTSKEIILQHIGQIGPVLSQNTDVILTVQMGFIGIWGENYYTDYFGDASNNGGQGGQLLDENWTDRIEVLNALLDQLPLEMTVQVRYPQMKQRAVYGINALTTSAAIDESEAFSGSLKSRIGFHNDCLFASADDFGTYRDYGNSSSPSVTDIPNLKGYFEDDGKYGIVGGETCNDGYSPQNNCSPEGIADIDLRALHYTYLNSGYNQDVNSDWVDGGCMDDIIRNLGYRIVLDSASLPEEVVAGELLNVDLYLSNRGYAAPVKERPVYLVLKNSEEELMFEFDTEIRFWFSYVALSKSIQIPANISTGTYEMFLYLPDINSSLSDRPEYAIRLANTDLWDATTGMNMLNHSIEIK